MNLGELRAAYRLAMFDTAAPYLWSDAEINGYINDAVNEAAIRAKLIQDETTDAVCKLDLVADTHTYTLHSKICGIYRVKVDGDTRPLARKSREEMDMEYPGWETQTGKPQIFTELNDASLIRFVPVPYADVTSRMVVWRLPLNPLVADTDVPEIHDKHHVRLLHWARRCGYLKQDTETFDADAALRQEQLFIDSFGVRPDANVQRKRRESRSHVVRCEF